MMKTLLLALLLLFALPSTLCAQEAQAEFQAFIRYYEDEAQRTGIEPDETSTRDSRVLFLQQVVQRYCHPYWVMKRADPGRPLSDEVVVWIKPGVEYRKFGDFIISGGTSGYSYGSHLDGFLPPDQLLVSPLMPLPLGANTPGYLLEPLLPSASYTVPGCKPPTPEPPTPPPSTAQPYPDENAWWGAYYEVEVAKLYAEAKLPFPDNSAAFRWFTRPAFDIASGMTKEAAAAKHLAALRAALGLP